MKMTKMTALLLAAAMALTACGSTAAARRTGANKYRTQRGCVSRDFRSPGSHCCTGRTCRRNGGYLPADRYRPAGPRSYH